MLSDFIGDVELGLLDDMQAEVRKLREEMGEDTIKEEQQKMIKPMLDVIKREQCVVCCTFLLSVL